MLEDNLQDYVKKAISNFSDGSVDPQKAFEMLMTLQHMLVKQLKEDGLDELSKPIVAAVGNDYVSYDLTIKLKDPFAGISIEKPKSQNEEQDKDDEKVQQM